MKSKTTIFAAIAACGQAAAYAIDTGYIQGLPVWAESICKLIGVLAICLTGFYATDKPPSNQAILTVDKPPDDKDTKFINKESIAPS